MVKTAETHVAGTLVYCLIMKYCVPTHLVTENGPQLVGKYFAALWAFLVTTQLDTKRYHPQTIYFQESRGKGIARP